MSRKQRYVWSSGILSMCAAVLIGISCSAASVALFSCLIAFVLKDMGLAGMLAGFSLAAGAYTGSYIRGKYRRNYGMAGGILCGLIMYALILVCGHVFIGEFAGIKKLLLLAFFGAAGGVAGVNSKRPRYLYQ
ncbi:MAG: hypothetical protein K6G33_13520 [Ruminococcus sp.]|uniref:hypothetical protein n=1 Tax=Ruminococcus sp. TaxID=41978 RepID=UPI0025D8FFE4|nr:hypothetical protein [Ruminococcus sp.]MCR5601745.1 hypothetical protein [Ruminococcus sp.]